MASIHESSESTEQEEQDYIYGVVPKEWCKIYRDGRPWKVKEGGWLTYIPQDSPKKYVYVLYQTTNIQKTENKVSYYGYWKVPSGYHGNTGPIHERHPTTKIGNFCTALDWYPITEEMAIKMRILHGF